MSTIETSDDQRRRINTSRTAEKQAARWGAGRGRAERRTAPVENSALAESCFCLSEIISNGSAFALEAHFPLCQWRNESVQIGSDFEKKMARYIRVLNGCCRVEPSKISVGNQSERGLHKRRVGGSVDGRPCGGRAYDVKHQRLLDKKTSHQKFIFCVQF